jgi:hypothetical protein
VPPEFQVNRLYQSFLQNLGTGALPEGNSPVRVQGTYERLKPAGFPLWCDPLAWATPSRRGAFKPPRFEVNQVFQSFCSASHPIEIPERISIGAGFSKAPM